MPNQSNDLHAPDAGFNSTRWSVVLLAGQSHSPESSAALEKLCCAYWDPLYFFLLRRGCAQHDAEDLTQAFFARLLEKRVLRVADPERGKFRSFLLGSMKHFLANESDKARAQKRGGGQPAIPLDIQAAEERYLCEAADLLTPEKIYERRWVQAVLDRSLLRLQRKCEADGFGRLFAELQPYLTDEPDAPSHAEIAARLEMTPQAVKSAIHRLRLRFRELCRAEIAETLADPSKVDEEIRELLAALKA
jgi:RNA polymerase sigma factor (sigma-70 family)